MEVVSPPEVRTDLAAAATEMAGRYAHSNMRLDVS